jgi:hypothetical protein
MTGKNKDHSKITAAGNTASTAIGFANFREQLSERRASFIFFIGEFAFIGSRMRARFHVAIHFPAVDLALEDRYTGISSAYRRTAYRLHVPLSVEIYDRHIRRDQFGADVDEFVPERGNELSFSLRLPIEF